MSEKVPISRLKKQQLVWLATHRCAHGHTYLSHYGCYVPQQEKIGFLDIEASNLDADFGVVLSYCILDGDTGEILEAHLTREDIDGCKPGKEDRRVLQSVVKDLGKFDRIVTFYGTGFDVKFLRTRAAVTGVGFPPYGTLCHTDLYYVVRNRYKLSSNRLANACRVILGRTQKTRIRNECWLGAARGDEKSMAYVVDHNRKDVLDLHKLYKKVINSSQARNVSI